MKRKLLIVLLSLIAALGCLFAFSGCRFGRDGKDGTNGEDGKDGKDGVGIERAEYNDDGEMIIYYTDGTSINLGKAPECEHSYVGPDNDGRAATCTNVGYSVLTCSKCGYVRYYIVPALGHSFGEAIETIKPTCTQKGIKISTCTVCGDTKVDTIPALNHALNTVEAKKPTCTQIGWNSYQECSRCDYTTYEEIPATGHTPTFGSDGINPLVCKDCGTAFIGETLDGYLSSFNSTYGYDYLSTLKNSGMKKLYSAIDEEAKKFHVNGADADGDTAFEIDYSPYGITADEAVKVWKTYRDDNPLYYWMTGTLTYTVESISVKVEEQYADGKARFAKSLLLDEKIRELKNKYKGESSAYMLALAYHDEIINTVDYAYSSGNIPETENWAHNICGVLDGRGAVCEGYAKTFQLLLNVSGVNNIFVTGKSQNQDHAWNLVEVDNGKWYWYDLTWDDTPNNYWGIQYNYLCATESNFLKNHTLDKSNGNTNHFLYYLPVRASEEYDSGYMGREFTSINLKYRVVGYNILCLTEAHKDGSVVIPETVSNGGRIYTVVAIGADKNSPFRNVVRDGFDDVNNCYEVTFVSIPKSVIYIDDNPFRFYTLEGITVDEQNPVYRTVDGVLFTKSLYTLIAYPAAKAGISYTISDNTCIVAYNALEDLVYLETLTIGKSVRTAGLTNWYGRRYPDCAADDTGGNVVSGEWGLIVWALRGDRLMTVHAQNEHYKVRDDLLYDSSYTVVLAALGNKEHYDIPEGVKKIERYAFNNRLTLKSVTFPDSLERIEDASFSNCYYLERVRIPANVSYIRNAFSAQYVVITVDEDSKYFTEIDGIIYNKELTEIVFAPAGLTAVVVLPDTVTRIDNGMFSFCKKLTSITIPASVTYIGYHAFWYCENLTSIKFGGTKAQWYNINKGSEWNKNMGIYIVYCTDGNIFNG